MTEPPVPNVPADPSAQTLIDALSITLGRPVLLDDAGLAPLAYSRQWDVDEVRSESILSRGPSPEVRRALLAQGIASASDVIHTEPDQALGMAGRVCMPIRDGEEPLGYIWLLDPEQDLGEEDLERVRRAARELAPLMTASTRRDVPDEAELLDGLRSSSRSRREAAAAEARERHLLAEGPVVLCLLAALEASADPLAAVRRAARRLSIGHAIAASAAEGAALVASLGDPVLRTLDEGEVATWLLAVGGPGLAAGQSAAAEPATLDEASHQAELALRIARSRRGQGAAAAWSTLGADRLIGQLPVSVRRDLPDPLARLIREDRTLTETLAAFLD
ncbi:MAG TPA: GAF domain-containing protein, partial [Solirubrobacterales bacterium]|nr:GAF domain-containing protein [Solirubrobacterales bacterium]